LHYWLYSSSYFLDVLSAESLLLLRRDCLQSNILVKYSTCLRCYRHTMYLCFHKQNYYTVYCCTFNCLEVCLSLVWWTCHRQVLQPVHCVPQPLWIM
jgi:hypothetical protein